MSSKVPRRITEEISMHLMEFRGILKEIPEGISRDFLGQIPAGMKKKNKTVFWPLARRMLALNINENDFLATGH